MNIHDIDGNAYMVFIIHHFPILHILTQSTLKSNPLRRYYCYHLMDKETKAQRLNNLLAGNQQS